MIFLDHAAAFFDHADQLVARLLALVVSIGGLLAAVRAMIQNAHATQAVAYSESANTIGTTTVSGSFGVTGEDKKATAMRAMAEAPLLLRASPARADKLIERKVAKLKARTSVVPE